MGQLRNGVPLDLARQLREATGITVAIETGTFRGASAVALAGLFDEVWTIELSADLHRAAVARHGADRRIHFLQGSSVDLLGQAASSTDRPALYWLDGHWSGAETAGVEFECPVLPEIDAIDASRYGADACILIDDAHLFLGPPPPPHRHEHWPTFMAVMDRLRLNHERFVTVLEDVIIAVPIHARSSVEAYWFGVMANGTNERPSRRLRITTSLPRRGSQR